MIITYCIEVTFFLMLLLNHQSPRAIENTFALSSYSELKSYTKAITLSF